MDTWTTPTTLRSRLEANSAVEEQSSRRASGSSTADDDPFAGDDILWADEDWAHDVGVGEAEGLRFFSGLVLGLAVSALAWLAIAGAAYLALQVIT